MTRVRNVDVKVQLVADIERSKQLDATKLVRVEPAQQDVQARVSVDTGGFSDGGSVDAATLAKTGTDSVVQGGGVLGFLMQEKAGVEAPAVGGVEDPSKTSLADLARFVGHDVTATYFDKDEYSSLEEANRRGDSLTTTGTLLGSKAGGLQLEGERGPVELDSEFWHVAEVQVRRAPYNSRGQLGSLAELNEVLLPGAEVTAHVPGEPVTAGVFLGVDKDDRGAQTLRLLVAGIERSLRGSDVSHVETPGYQFLALAKPAVD